MSGRSPKKSLPSPSSSSKGSKSGSRQEIQVSEWSEWEWEEPYRREYRSRENPVGSGEWEYDFRYPETDDTTSHSSQLELTGGLLGSNRPASLGYTTSSSIPGRSPPSRYATVEASTGASPRLARSSLDSSQTTSPLSISMATYSGLSLRTAPALAQYDEAYQGASAVERTATGGISPTQLMTDSRGYPVGGRNIQAQPYAEGDDDNGNNAPLAFLSPYQTSYAEQTVATNLQPSDARQRSDTNESDRRITSMDGTTSNESLDPNYKVHAGKDFRFARVFKILWTEPKGQGKGGETKGTDIIPVKYGENAYASIRRFVVVKALEGHCLCLPILTYGGQATKKKGVKPQDHAIVYMIQEGKGQKGNSGEAVEKPKEIDGEQKLTKRPIRIKSLTPRDQLDPRSRLNYAKIYTVEYNVKVCFIGSVHENSEKYFTRDFNLVHTPLPEDPDTQFSDEERDLSVSPQGARARRPREQREPREQRDQDERQQEPPRERKEKKDKHPRGKGSGRS